MKNDRPNVLFILIDDMGWMDLSCQGSTFYETPNIDRIAREGMRFTRAYASCPVCSPTRASILTGKYPARLGITQWIGGSNRGRVIDAPYLHYLPLEEKTIARALKDRGYNTYHVGKWHLGDEPYWPEHHGFDVNVAGCHWGSPWNGYFSPWGIPTLKNGPDGEYLTDRLTREAIALLEKNGKSPFFMYMSYYSVHRPVQAPAESIEKFKKKARMLGLDKRDAFRDDGTLFCLEGQPPQRNPTRVIQSDPDYAGMIARLDFNIGLLLGCLERLGIAKNTIVVFYSDNGGLSDGVRAPTANLPLRNGKSYMYEGGIREPLLIRWPGIVPAGSTSDQLVTSCDFYPTLLDCCGAPRMPEQHVDGTSFYPVLSATASTLARGPVFWHYPHHNGNGGRPASCIIDEEWKLIQWLDDGRVELFNLKTDPGEGLDLASTQPDIAGKLLSLLKQWQDETKARMPEPNPRYPFYLARKFVTAEGMLVSSEDSSACIKMPLSASNPVEYNIPISDILEEFLDKTVVLKIHDVVRVGYLSTGKNGELMFMDTHEEQLAAVASYLGSMSGRKVAIRACVSEPLQGLGAEDERAFQDAVKEPRVEITIAP